MISGILTINVDPPYMAFLTQEKSHCLKHCTLDELRQLLLELKAFNPEQNWPPSEYILRLPGHFAQKTLRRFGLLDPAVSKSVLKSQAKLLPRVA